jgi:hypothetical protein
MPVYAALENHLPLVVGNPGHMKNLRGRKTDRKDAKPPVATTLRQNFFTRLNSGGH